ncbi:MAG: DUF418 domain-containing protein [Stackebrandtia sp.]
MTTHVDAPARRSRRGPTTRAERALAPDLARGAMLLLIALAHSTGVFFASVPGVDVTPHGLERFYNVFQFTFVHARGLPLFAIMFGYGLIQLAARQDAAGSPPSAVRALLLRRNAWLFGFGMVHGVFLFGGDILGAYGLIGIVFTLLLLRRSDRFYRIVVGYAVFAALYVLALGVMVALGMANDPNGRSEIPVGDFSSWSADSYLASVLVRLGEWPIGTAIFLPFILFIWMGAWAARRRVLEEPHHHRTLLRGGLVAGFAVSILGGLPMGLISGGFLHVGDTTAAWTKMLYEGSGLFGGVGYFCLFGLIALALSKRPAPRGVVVQAVSALGQRSLSGYLFQSAAWLVLASPYLLALDEKTGQPTFVAVGCALAVWLTSVVVAYRMQRRAYRGPAETLLRRLAYGRG